jgi:hypothetical protein
MVTGLDNGKPGESPGRKARGPTPGGSFASHSGHGSQFSEGPTAPLVSRRWAAAGRERRLRSAREPRSFGRQTQAGVTGFFVMFPSPQRKIRAAAGCSASVATGTRHTEPSLRGGTIPSDSSMPCLTRPPVFEPSGTRARCSRPCLPCATCPSGGLSARGLALISGGTAATAIRCPKRYSTSRPHSRAGPSA